jgi:hypothetical protein
MWVLPTAGMQAPFSQGMRENPQTTRGRSASRTGLQFADITLQIKRERNYTPCVSCRLQKVEIDKSLLAPGMPRKRDCFESLTSQNTVIFSFMKGLLVSKKRNHRTRWKVPVKLNDRSL